MNERFVFSIEKSKKLKRDRGISFEECVELIELGYDTRFMKHPNQDLHPGQDLLLVKIDDYAYAIPCTQLNGKVFLHTIYPSRKFTRDYFRRNKS